MAFLLSTPSFCATLFSIVLDSSWIMLDSLIIIGISIISFFNKQILCKMQQAIIYFGIKSILCIRRVSKMLRKRPFNKPKDHSIILAEDKRLLKLVCRSDKCPLSLNGTITYFVRQ